MSLSDDLSLPISHSPPADGEFVASDSDTYTPPEVVDSADAIVQMSPAPGDLSLPETPPIDSGAGSSEFSIVTGATPTSRFGEVCADRRKAAAVLSGIALAVVLVVLLIISSSGDSSGTAGAALLVSGAPLQGDLQHAGERRVPGRGHIPADRLHQPAADEARRARDQRGRRARQCRLPVLVTVRDNPDYTWESDMRPNPSIGVCNFCFENT